MNSISMLVWTYNIMLQDRMAERVAFIEKGLPHIQPHINDTKKPVLAVSLINQNVQLSYT